MPIYEYQCKHCQKCCEVMQKMSDKPLTECPSCHKDALVRLISPAAFQLKGTGWYVTDYKNKDKPKVEKTEKTEKKEEKNQKKGDTS